MEKLAELLKFETGKKITFSSQLKIFEIISFVNGNERKLNLMKFLEKYEHCDELILMIKKQNENRKQYNLKKQLNCAMICYLITECKGYSIVNEKLCVLKNDFHFVKTISKNNEKYFEIDTHKNELKEMPSLLPMLLEEIQMKRIAELINKEKGITILFECGKNVSKEFKVLQFTDKNEKKIDVNEFIRKYNHHEKYIDYLKNSNESSESLDLQLTSKTIELFDSENQSKWKFQSPKTIENVLKNNSMTKMSFDKQRSFILGKINCSMLFYLLTECKGYKCYLSYRKVTKNQFIYITTIMKRKSFEFSIENYKNVTNNYQQGNYWLFWENIQMKKLAELIENESGMKITFFENENSNQLNPLELKGFVDHNGNEINLIEFLSKYDKFNELIQLLETKEMTIKVMKQFNKNNEEIQRKETFLSLFNSTLITILNHYHYIITFIRPESITLDIKDLFLYIKSIQKESENNTIFESNENEENNQINKIIKIINQLDEMMKIIDHETNIHFSFDIDKLIQSNSFKNFNITIDDKQISIDEFIQKYYNIHMILFITKSFSLSQTIENFQMDYFIKMNEKECNLQHHILLKTNDISMIDCWKRICLYLLIINGCSITFTNEFNQRMEKYLNVLKQIENYQLKQNEIISIDKIIHILNESCLIESIEKNEKKIILSETKELNKLNEIIKIVNEETNYEIIYEENNELSIPQYIKFKQNEMNQMKEVKKYSSYDFIEDFNVNKTIIIELHKQLKLQQIEEINSSEENNEYNRNEIPMEEIKETNLISHQQDKNYVELSQKIEQLEIKTNNNNNNLNNIVNKQNNPYENISSDEIQRMNKEKEYQIMREIQRYHIEKDEDELFITEFQKMNSQKRKKMEEQLEKEKEYIQKKYNLQIIERKNEKPKSQNENVNEEKIMKELKQFYEVRNEKISEQSKKLENLEQLPNELNNQQQIQKENRKEENMFANDYMKKRFDDDKI